MEKKKITAAMLSLALSAGLVTAVVQPNDIPLLSNLTKVVSAATSRDTASDNAWNSGKRFKEGEDLRQREFFVYNGEHYYVYGENTPVTASVVEVGIWRNHKTTHNKDTMRETDGYKVAYQNAIVAAGVHTNGLSTNTSAGTSKYKAQQVIFHRVDEMGEELLENYVDWNMVEANPGYFNVATFEYSQYLYDRAWYVVGCVTVIDYYGSTPPTYKAFPSPTPTPDPSHKHNYVSGVCTCGSIANGLAKVKGTWGYYVNGKLQTTKTGIVKKAASTDTNWYFVKNGIYTTASGIAKKADGSDANWYYVNNGVYTKANGIAKKAYGTDTNWYYVKNGVYTKANGIAKKADGSSATWYYVLNGIYTKSTGITKKADGSDSKWYYVYNGIFTKVTGITKKADSTDTKWYYVKDGVFTQTTAIAPICKSTNGKLYYVKGGLWTQITGKVTVGGKVYKITNGLVQQ